MILDYLIASFKEESPSLQSLLADLHYLKERGMSPDFPASFYSQLSLLPPTAFKRKNPSPHELEAYLDNFIKTRENSFKTDKEKEKREREEEEKIEEEGGRREEEGGKKEEEGGKQEEEENMEEEEGKEVEGVEWEDQTSKADNDDDIIYMDDEQMKELDKEIFADLHKGKEEVEEEEEEEEEGGEGVPPPPSLADLSHRILGEHKDFVLSLAFCPTNPNLLASGSGDDTASLWDIRKEEGETMEEEGEKEGRREEGGKMEEEKKEQEGRRKERKEGRGREGRRRTIKANDSVSVVGFNFDGTLLACASMDNLVSIYEVEEGLRKIAVLEGPTDEITFIEWHSKANFLIAGSNDGTTWLWKIIGGGKKEEIGGKKEEVGGKKEEGGEIREEGGEGRKEEGGGSREEGERKREVGVGRKEEGVSREEGGKRKEGGLTVCVFQGHFNGVTAGKWIKDGRGVLTVSEDKTLRIWEPKSGECLLKVGGYGFHEQAVLVVEVNGNIAVTGGEDGVACLCNVENGKILGKSSHFEDAVESVLFVRK